MTDFLQYVELWAELWAASLWRASWQGAIVVAGVWCVAGWWRSLSPRVACWWWRLVCIKLLVALFWSQPVRLALLPAETTASPAVVSVPSTAVGPVPAPSSPLGAEEEPHLAPPAVAEQAGISVSVLLVLLWLAGVVYSAVGVGRQCTSVRRLLALATLEPNHSLDEIYRQEAERLGVRHPPRLRMSPKVDSPLLAGIWRPTIVLPNFVGQAFDAVEVRLMLAHELTHHRRRDLVWNWLPAITKVVFFFHPLVWLLIRRLCEAQEAACDELLIQSRLAQPAEYGRLLLKLAAREPLRSQPGLAAAGVLGAYRDLERRILNMTRVRPFSFRRLVFAAGTLALIAAPSLIPWRLTAQEAAKAAADDDNPAAANQSEQLLGRIYVWAALDLSSDADWPHNYRGVISVDPNTGSWEKAGPLGQTMRLSPDGRRVAFSEYKPRWTREGIRGGASELFLAGIQNAQPVKLMEGAALRAWSPDARRLLYQVNSGTNGWHGTSWTINLETNEKQKLPVPETDQVEDWSSQGNWLVTISDRDVAAEVGYQLYVMHPDGSAEHRVTEGKWGNLDPRFSPDGKQIAYIHATRRESSLWIVNVDGSNPRQIVDQQAKAANLGGLCWSPDGRWLAMKVVENPNELPRDRTARLDIVAVADGARRTLQLENVTVIHFLQTPEWR